MLKFTDTYIGFREVPDEVTLCINISNCPCHCKGCHSAYLAQDIGEALDVNSLCVLLSRNDGVSCVSFMGGDSCPSDVNNLAKYVKQTTMLKTCWYSGRQTISTDIDLNNFDFVKIGPYVEALGPLDRVTTNQHLYQVSDNKMIDVTSKLQRKQP